MLEPGMILMSRYYCTNADDDSLRRTQFLQLTLLIGCENCSCAAQILLYMLQGHPGRAYTCGVSIVVLSGLGLS